MSDYLCDRGSRAYLSRQHVPQDRYKELAASLRERVAECLESRRFRNVLCS